MFKLEAIHVTLLVGILAPMLTYFATKHKNSLDFDKEMQKTNVENASTLYDQYAKMNQALQDRVDKLQDQCETLQDKYENLQEKYENFQDKYEQETNFYKSEIERLETQIDVLETENQKLADVNHDLQEKLDKIIGEV